MLASAGNRLCVCSSITEHRYSAGTRERCVGLALRYDCVRRPVTYVSHRRGASCSHETHLWWLSSSSQPHWLTARSSPFAVPRRSQAHASLLPSLLRSSLPHAIPRSPSLALNRDCPAATVLVPRAALAPCRSPSLAALRQRAPRRLIGRIEVRVRYIHRNREVRAESSVYGSTDGTQRAIGCLDRQLKTVDYYSTRPGSGP